MTNSTEKARDNITGTINASLVTFRIEPNATSVRSFLNVDQGRGRRSAGGVGAQGRRSGSSCCCLIRCWRGFVAGSAHEITLLMLVPIGIALVFGGSFVFPAPTTNWNIPQSSALGPISPAILAEVARLREVVVVVVAELGVERFTAGAFEQLAGMWLQPPLHLLPISASIRTAFQICTLHG